MTDTIESFIDRDVKIALDAWEKADDLLFAAIERRGGAIGMLAADVPRKRILSIIKSMKKNDTKYLRLRRMK